MGRGKGFLQVIEKEVRLETGRRTRLPWYLIAPRNFCILNIESKNEEESVAGVGHAGKMMWLLRARAREWLKSWTRKDMESVTLMGQRKWRYQRTRGLPEVTKLTKQKLDCAQRILEFKSSEVVTCQVAGRKGGRGRQ